ncbi:MAG TPA: T9SS type A sorting domain-containing protein [Bacteroidia bacterium]|nr:T9SS type A sorting domain-containing protein [Bacteroidia bacterium]
MKHISSFFLSLIIVLIPHVSKAQAPLYLKAVFHTAPTGVSMFQSGFLLQRADKNTLNFGSFAPAATITKLDSTGNPLWCRSYRFDKISNIDFKLIDAVNAQDSTFAAIGMTASNIGTPGADAFCLKFKANGDTLWCRKFHTTGATRMEPRSISATLDSGFVVCGLTTTLYVQGPDQHAFVAKLSKTGALSWIKTFNNSFYYSDAFTIKQTADSGYICLGEQGLSYEWCTTLSKFDQSGNLSWQKQYCETNSGNKVSGMDLIVQNNGYLCVLASDLNKKPLLLKTNLSGNPVWAKKYDLPVYNMYNYYRPINLKKLSEKRCQVTFKGVNGLESWTMGTDTAGNVLSKAQVRLQDIDLVPNKNKTLCIVGNRGPIPLDSSPIGAGEVGVIITDSLGTGTNECYSQGVITSSVVVLQTPSLASNLISGGAIAVAESTISAVTLSIVSGCMGFGTGIAENDEGLSLSVYPNPTNAKVYFSSAALQGQSVKFRLSDITGRIQIIKRYTFETAVLEMDLSSFNSGVYFYSIFAEGGAVKHGKLIISK